MFNFSSEQINAILAAIKLKDLERDNKEILLEMIKDNKSEQSKIELFVDGAADLHSKTAGIGGVIYSNGSEISTFSDPLFEKTNNESEYLALIKGVEVLIDLNLLNVEIFSDSELVVKQVSGEYKIKNERMKKLNFHLKNKLHQLHNWSLTHVKRDKNIRADELSKEGLDKAKI